MAAPSAPNSESASAEIARLEDLLERQESEKRDLQNQVYCRSTLCRDQVLRSCTERPAENWVLTVYSSRYCTEACMHVKCMYYVQVKQLKHFAHALEQEVRSLKHTNKILESSVQERVSREVLEQLKKQHSVHKYKATAPQNIKFSEGDSLPSSLLLKYLGSRILISLAG